jgi:6-phosphogluconolactonase
MGNYSLSVFSNSHDLADRAAARFITQLRDRGGQPCAVALCGGRVAELFFKALVRQAKTEAAPLADVDFFWADERCVSPIHPDSNYGQAREKLLDPLGVKRERIHRIEGELPPVEAAERASETAQRIARTGPDGNPVFDFILLSMGEDGHVASLFPGAKESADEAKLPYRFVLGAKPPPERITLSYSTIRAAVDTWVLVSEPEKAVVLRQSLRPDGQTPLATVIQQREHTEVYTAFPV